MERLTEIITEVATYGHMGGKVHTKLIETAKASILARIKEIMPEKKNLYKAGFISAKDYNQAIDEITEIIEGEFK